MYLKRTSFYKFLSTTSKDVFIPVLNGKWTAFILRFSSRVTTQSAFTMKVSIPPFTDIHSYTNGRGFHGPECQPTHQNSDDPLYLLSHSCAQKLNEKLTIIERDSLWTASLAWYSCYSTFSPWHIAV